MEVVDSLRFRGPQTNAAANNIVGESCVLGAAFNPANQGKIIVVDGQSGVYVVKVEAQTATAVASANVGKNATRNNQGMQSKALCFTGSESARSGGYRRPQKQILLS